MNQRIRNDGKPARTPRLGVPQSRHNGKKADLAESAPIWEDLVQPGPAGNPKRTYQRREDRGQVVRLNSEVEPFPTPARRVGPVRLGHYSPPRSRKAARPQPSERIRAVKGSRTDGYVEIRRAFTPMEKIRQRPVSR